MRRLLLSGLAALLLPAWNAAVAQEPSLRDGPRRVSEKTARAEAEALIAATPLPQSFQPGAWTLGPVVTHLASGLICPLLSRARGNAVNVYDLGQGEGGDVGCLMPTPAFNQSLFASRLRNVGSAEAAFDGAVRMMRLRQPGLTEVAEPKQAPPNVRLGRFVTGDGDRALYERVAVFQKGDWVINQRLTAPAGIMAAADRAADVALAANMRSATQ